VIALPARARALAREVRDGGRGDDPRRLRVGTLRGQAGGEVLLDGGPALTRVAADEHARLGDAEGAHDRAADGLHRRRIQRRLPRPAANAVGPEESTHPTILSRAATL
jgi:hypothetical protein